MFVFPSCQASDWEKLQKTLADALEHYNELHAVMDLVLFEEAIQHVYGTHAHTSTYTQRSCKLQLEIYHLLTCIREDLHR